MFEYALVLNGFAVLANGVCAWWLKEYVKQKEELKDNEISNIRSIIQTKDAYIGKAVG